MSTISHQLALILVKEVIAEKRNNKVSPSYALGMEVGARNEPERVQMAQFKILRQAN